MGVEQNSPIRTPGVPNTAVDDATDEIARRGKLAAGGDRRTWTAAITGCGSTGRYPSSPCRPRRSPASSRAFVRSSRTDRAGGEHRTGRRDSTTTRTASSLPKPWSAAVTARIMLVDSGFRWPAGQIGQTRDARPAVEARPDRIIHAAPLPASTRSPMLRRRDSHCRPCFVRMAGHTPGRSRGWQDRGREYRESDPLRETAARSAAVTVRAIGWSGRVDAPTRPRRAS